MTECDCPTEHTITKLGHCKSCSWYARAERRRIQETGVMRLFVCSADRHSDGSPHDFSWATYADATTTYGVCRCGEDQMSRDMMRCP